ncbi:hypothetical protein SAMD00019534_056990, partial [Acytostelium subglobosum LB1]|uniref:hypothetical protein n=1 Tax=Acytostelium subglobosum LB1 TaxID=1410327 RepID=UPI000644F3D0
MSSEDISKIFPGFYIGSLAAVKRDTLDEYQITHVLSIMNGFKPKWPKMYKFHVIDIYDMDDVDIKKYFEQTFEFIEEGRRDGAVLVHCFAGMSRSASICIAYLMKKLKIDYSDAHGLMVDARPIVYPNPGFVRQLKEFEQELIVQRKKAEKAALKAERAEKAEKAESLIVEQIESLTVNDQTTTKTTTTTVVAAESLFDDDEEDAEEFRYCCRKCGSDLFVKSEIAEHQKGDGQESFKWSRRERTGHKDECTSFFLCETEWISKITMTPENDDNRIVCHNAKCKEKLGSWSWSGAQCSCGAWVAPSFQIPKSRVDEKRVNPVAAANTKTTDSVQQQQQQQPLQQSG